MTKLYLHTCFIRVSFWIYDRYSESFWVISKSKKKPEVWNWAIYWTVHKFIKTDKEAAKLFKKYWLRDWNREVKKTEILKENAQTPNILILDELTKWQDSEAEILVKKT